MKPPSRAPTVLLVAILAISVAGCAGTGPEARAPSPSPMLGRGLHAGLVLPGAAPGRGATVAAWEFARNDRTLGAPPRPLEPQFSAHETRNRQRLFITNGRPRESSVFSSRTYQRRSGR